LGHYSNRDVEMGINGEGMKAGVERDDREDWKGKENSSNTTSWEM